MTSIYKDLDLQNDLRIVQRISTEDLFFPSKGIVKPFDSNNNVTITTSSASETYSTYYNKVSFVSNSGSNSTYFSYVRAESASYGVASGSGMNYWGIKHMIQPENSSYLINDNSYSNSSSKLDIIAVNREYYKDSLDETYFTLLFHTGSADETTSLTEFNYGNGVVGLVPSTTKFNTPIGDKFFLYATTSSYTSTIYNSTTDEFTMPAQTDLVTSQPYGELYTQAGIVILYVDKLEDDYGALASTEVKNYVAGVVGRSKIQLNGAIYFVRALSNEFNYSTNKTFYQDSQGTIIKDAFQNDPVTYITGVGLYNNRNELVAFGRPYKPIKKSFSDEANFKIELNY